MTDLGVTPDAFDVRFVRSAPRLLREFNAAGVLAAADVHVALRLTALAGEPDEAVALAIAFAVRAPRLGHVLVDLATIRDTATVDADEPVDLSELPWPPADDWLERVAASELVGIGDDAGSSLPLRLVGSWLHLDRYWREERQIAADLGVLSDSAPGDVRLDVLAAGLERVVPGGPGSRQRLAAASAVLRRLTVVAGGPGTGKTTTVAGIVALLAEQALACGSPPPLVALAAPTGKAAARLEESVHREAARLTVEADVRDQLLALSASTLHRLLGWRPDSHSRFRHNRSQRLPHDVVIVDETSMVSLSLMGRLVEAIRPDARLILVGDPGQLASIEAGAVLGDIVGPAAAGLLLTPPARARLEEVTGVLVMAGPPPPGASVADGIVVLDVVHRFGEGIGGLAEAIRRGDADEVIRVLTDAPEGVKWIRAEAGDPEAEAALAPVRGRAVKAGREVAQAAREGAAGEALAALGSFRVLCAHRRGPDGAATWNARVEGWLGATPPKPGADARWSVGRPVLINANDYDLQLYNGDTGVVVQTAPDRVAVAFERRGRVDFFSPSRLGPVDTVHAMTIHKSQGSQFATAVVLLPGPASRILTRELLYTAATRAQDELILVGTEETIRAGVERPVARASGLRRRLWNDSEA